MGKIEFRPLKTERLRLRHPTIHDEPAQFEFMKDKRKFPYADYPVVSDISEVKNYFYAAIHHRKEDSLFWLIADLKSDSPMGALRAWNADFEANSIEFGYYLYPEFRGQGYLREALECVMDYCQHTLGFQSFIIWTQTHNLPAIRLARAMGFTEAGCVEEVAKHFPGTITYATFEKRWP